MIKINGKFSIKSRILEQILIKHRTYTKVRTHLWTEDIFENSPPSLQTTCIEYTPYFYIKPPYLSCQSKSVKSALETSTSKDSVLSKNDKMTFDKWWPLLLSRLSLSTKYPTVLNTYPEFYSDAYQNLSITAYHRNKTVVSVISKFNSQKFSGLESVINCNGFLTNFRSLERITICSWIVDLSLFFRFHIF